MNEVWKKPPVSFEAYQLMVGKEIGVSSGTWSIRTASTSMPM